MPRYVCIYYEARTLDEVNKLNKRSRIIESRSSAKVKEKLVDEYDATYIKSIRDMFLPQYYIKDLRLFKVEQENNLNIDG